MYFVYCFIWNEVVYYNHKEQRNGTKAGKENNMFVYKDAVGFIGNIGVWLDDVNGYVLVDLLTGNRLYVH